MLDLGEILGGWEIESVSNLCFKNEEFLASMLFKGNIDKFRKKTSPEVKMSDNMDKTAALVVTGG